MKTPESQSNASVTSGTVSERRPPNRNAEMGTPSGFSHSGSIDGHWEEPTVNRAFESAAFRPQSGVHFWPCQSIRFSGGESVIPSHQTSPSGVRATLVKIVLLLIIAMQFLLVFSEVPGATPKIPDSGLIA